MVQKAACFSIIGRTPRIPTKHGFNMDGGVDAVFPQSPGLQRTVVVGFDSDEYFDSFFIRYEQDLIESDLFMPCPSLHRSD